MSRMQRRARSRAPRAQASFARDLRTILRGLARAAAISAVGIAGCGQHHMAEDLGQNVPDPGQEHVTAGTRGGPVPGLYPPSAGSGTVTPPGVAGGVATPMAGSGGAAPLPPEVDAGRADAGPESASWASLGCSSTEGRPPLLTNLRTTRAVDYAAVYFTISAQFGDGTYDLQRALSSGTPPCAAATDPEACRAALQALLQPTPTCGVDWGCDPFLVITAGDEVSRIEERAALMALLGPLDTLHEPALVALLLGDQTIACPTNSTRSLRGTEARQVGDGYEVRTEWEECGEGLFSRTVHVDANGNVSELEFATIGVSLCNSGRRPEGLHVRAPAVASTPLGAYFASAAALEAASVVAFARLARELDALDAPRELVSRATRSALEEVRHAHAVGELARRFGCAPRAPEIGAHAERSAQAIALENAVEGCVRETYGALVAHYQAETAADPVVRAVMAVIAEDETRHAALSWQIAAWLEPRLSRDERRVVHAARADALAALRGELHSGLRAADRATMGLPEPQLGLALLDRMASALGLVG